MYVSLIAAFLFAEAIVTIWSTREEVNLVSSLANQAEEACWGRRVLYDSISDDGPAVWRELCSLAGGLGAKRATFADRIVVFDNHLERRCCFRVRE